jgi:hypothetical protein
MGTFSVLTDVTRHSAACRRPFIKQAAIEMRCIRASQRTLHTKVVVGTVRLLILGSAICTGIWLGIRPLEAKVRPALTLPHSHPVQIKQSPCSGIKVDAFQVPPGYALVNITPIGQDCFALLKAQDTEASSAFGLGGGVADVFGRDGRLVVRFFALGRPNGRWELFEYRRLPVDDFRQSRTQ